MAKYDVKEMIRDGKKVKFQYFQAGNLYYETETGFLFSVPISDCGSEAKFLAEDKASFFMRYINKQIKNLEAEEVAMVAQKEKARLETEALAQRIAAAQKAHDDEEWNKIEAEILEKIKEDREK